MSNKTSEQAEKGNWQERLVIAMQEKDRAKEVTEDVAEMTRYSMVTETDSTGSSRIRIDQPKSAEEYRQNFYGITLRNMGTIIQGLDSLGAKGIADDLSQFFGDKLDLLSIQEVFSKPQIRNIDTQGQLISEINSRTPDKLRELLPSVIDFSDKDPFKQVTGEVLAKSFEWIVAQEEKFAAEKLAKLGEHINALITQDLIAEGLADFSKKLAETALNSHKTEPYSSFLNTDARTLGWGD